MTDKPETHADRCRREEQEQKAAWDEAVKHSKAHDAAVAEEAKAQEPPAPKPKGESK